MKRSTLCSKCKLIEMLEGNSNETKGNRGNISKYYRGKKPISDTFWEKFHKAYEIELNDIKEKKKNKAVEYSPLEASSTVHQFDTYRPILQESLDKMDDKLSTMQTTLNANSALQAEDRKLLQLILDKIEKLTPQEPDNEKK